MTIPTSSIVVDPVRVFCFTGDRNAPDKPADFTGAFNPECLAFMKHWKIDAANRTKIDLSKGDQARYEQTCKFIEDRTKELHKAPTALIFFCHGLQAKLQLGIKLANVQDFAKKLRKLHVDYGSAAQQELVICLYACSSGGGPGPGGDNGLADRLRDALCVEGFTKCRVYAHEVSGHTTKNPRKRVFEGLGSPVGGTGGLYLVAPGSSLFRKWVKALQDVHGEMRFRYAFLTIAELHTELTKIS